jgi:hypothetical protein
VVRGIQRRFIKDFVIKGGSIDPANGSRFSVAGQASFVQFIIRCNCVNSRFKLRTIIEAGKKWKMILLERTRIDGLV